MMRSYVILCILLSLVANNLSAKNELDSLYRELDNKIKNCDIYIELKEFRIEELKAEKLKLNTPISTTYNLNLAIYKEYRSYISDSAIQYLNQNLDIAYSLKDRHKINEISIYTANLFSDLGMYKEASDIMANADRNFTDEYQKTNYYTTYRNIFTGLGLYTQNNRDRWKYWQKASLYADTIFSVTNPNSEDYLRLEEIRYREQNKIDEALEINDKRLKQTKNGSPAYALIAFERSLLYRRKNDIDMEKKYLILSAISDIQSAIKDNASIPILSNMLMQEGDVNRAYTYVRFSLDNINDYNTRIRSSEIINIQSIIDKAYQEKSNEQRKKLRIFLIITSILSVLLIISVCYVYKQMRKGILITKRQKETNLELNSLNQKLHNMNNNLKNINIEVTEANYIKEEYIGYFLDQCSKYIEKMDEYRKMVNKKIQNKEIEELFKITKNNHLKDEELKEFFTNFDNMFIHLFPDFVEKFNSLLQDDEKIILKKGEVLNTELRIYALMRLGIDDSTKIASFLGYSVNTIYNYRAKIKNKAKISREDFEWTVKKISTFHK
ncbi:hypothetical protein M2451_003389 [Dysgonomonas sp. PFB1-18]|uniref:DUF6377 domain-containing protein n=1 Tax=unclassified Dysgonomonas TaxID=2630389 RepID=UPI002475E387|nr:MULTISPECIES: DUF6377 domain-containing protein [unclassified Dysgonomonas]MDH6310521.1 hypothetical protein [Dysgonomonas sp. PF1-14]MDH6340371.1 hypothetical protein [Dysgonomonas sp. PF1-16]MDH6382049.1 hypothetical protein [Dysgonomonas sp. PFB1-18]MDH6399342.1 hypothetical protein [Dysgonomonas sp. PF1-23]